MTAAAAVVAAAVSRIGCRYSWGGSGPDDFDCSGLVQWCYAQAGVAVPRTSQDQSGTGRSVPRDQLQPGDIIVYYPDASHVGLYSGNGNVIHASTYGVPVAEVPLDNAGPFNCARRYLPPTQGSSLMVLYGPDLSNNNWNSTGEIAGWLNECFHVEGYSWMEHKVSEGNYYADPFWPAVRDWCAANSVPCIGYHYVTEDDPASQAAKFVSNGGGTVAMLDVEANSGDIGNFWAVVNAFNAAGVQINLSYIPHWYWEQIGSPDLSQVPGLISSSYFGNNAYGSVIYENAGGDGGAGWNAYGGATPAIWQFTDGALVGGKSVDANAFRGSLTDLTALLTGVPEPSAPPAPPAPARILPMFFTVEGHQSDMFSGPVADTATQLESEGLCHHQPIGYDNGAIPFDNASGVNELARLVGATVMDNGVPFPAGTKWVLGIFSQGAIVGYDFWAKHMMPGCDLAWRAPDCLGILAYGDPNRATNSCAPWSVAQASSTDGTHGLDPLKRWDLPGCAQRPANFADVWRKGDIFAQNTSDEKGKIKASIYQAVARGDVVSFGGSTTDLAAILVTQIVPVTSGNYLELLAFAVSVIEAIINGVVFLADQPNPHYSPYNTSGGINWTRGLLTA